MDGVCGIQAKEKQITICPHPNKALGHAKAVYQSPVGTISSGWKYEGNKVIYEIEIPSNTKAKIILPDGRNEEVVAGKYCF